MSSRRYRKGSVFSVELDQERRLREMRKHPFSGVPWGGVSFEVAVVEMQDDGRFVDRRQLQAALAVVRKARARNAGMGALVVLFVHGWHHGSRWRDSHFQGFRRVLAFLAGREAERPGGPRRVVGIYVGWNGDPKGVSLRGALGLIPKIEHATFWNRYETALQIANTPDILRLFERLAHTVKMTRGQPSQLILMGHSMGGLILEAALLELAEGSDGLLGYRDADPSDPVTTLAGSSPVLFPDAVITLNSAADSWFAGNLVKVLQRRKVSRTASDGRIQYAAPLLVSATSSADTATGQHWPRGMELLRDIQQRPGWQAALKAAGLAGGPQIRKFEPDETLATVGHSSLQTHSLRDGGVCKCSPKKFYTVAPGQTQEILDFGQEFHCLRDPEPLKSRTPLIPLDLPIRERLGREDPGEHRRYRLEPKGPRRRAEPIWNFQVPPAVIPDHNDIFNPSATSLILALIQISGAVASLASHWSESFEGPAR